MIAAAGPSKARNGSTWARIRVDPVGDHGSGSLSVALGGRLGVADQPGGAADQGDRPVAGELEPAQRQQLDEVPRCRLGAVGSNPQ